MAYQFVIRQFGIFVHASQPQHLQPSEVIIAAKLLMYGFFSFQYNFLDLFQLG